MWPVVSGFFDLHSAPEVHRHCGMYQYSVPYFGWIILLYIHLTFVYSLSVGGHLSCFRLAIVNSASINIRLQVYEYWSKASGISTQE